MALVFAFGERGLGKPIYSAAALHQAICCSTASRSRSRLSAGDFGVAALGSVPATPYAAARHSCKYRWLHAPQPIPPSWSPGRATHYAAASSRYELDGAVT